MNRSKFVFANVLAVAATLALDAPAWALTGVQIGASGSTYASAAVACALNPTIGMAPVVRAGLYNPKKSASASVSLNGTGIATVTFANPDTDVWLANGPNTVAVTLSRKVVDAYSFDASSTYPGQPNICIPDSRANIVNGDLEYAASLKSYATLTAGCALNPLNRLAQPFVNLFDNGSYLLNVSVNNIPLTQLDGTRRTHTPIFLAAGLNVISAANGAVSTDFYVRDGGNGTCTLP